ncbi:MAG TPA: flagellar biosynthesis protein FlhA [Bdellovibrionota bacterium]|nr:flagellar biosynthesis protein FlhA [Bdellovibrionota bacterium]
MDQILARLQVVFRNSDVVLGVAVMAVIAIMVLPMHPIVMDFALVLSFMIALGILMLAIYTEKPLDFSVFPTLLLITTLFRLALNVASTRLILSEGHIGGDAAGSLIGAFGEVVMGGNYVVGFVVFVILVIINFVVITKGSGRVSEVAARFTLDSLPGKQMAIDADLNAGIINEQEAKRRRKELEAEADFYGSMDGASKFVRGDAIAGILVTIVNIVGGLIIGTLQKNLDIATAAKNYTLLTVGDGLVSQIPALVISTAAGLVVTRASGSDTLSKQVSAQLFNNEKVFYITSGALFSIGIFLNGAFFPFFVLSMMCLGFGLLLKRNKENNAAVAAKQAAESNLETKDKTVEPSSVDTLQIEVGYGLISVVEGTSTSSSDLLDRIQSIRKQFAQDLGIVVPTVNIKDNLELKPGEYVIMVKGVETARGELMVDMLMAMDPGDITDPVDGIDTKEPVFGLDAVWITEKNKEMAQLAGYTVVDLSTVIATHLTEVVRKSASDLVGRQEVQALIDIVRRSHPKVVEDLIPKELSLGVVVQVFKNLLREEVPIRDLVSILEALGDGVLETKDPTALTELVRARLGRIITSRLLNEDGELPLVTFTKDVEEQLINAVQPGDKGTTQFLADPTLIKRLVPATNNKMDSLGGQGVHAAILVTPMIRHHVKRMLDRFLPNVSVVSHNEIHPKLRVRSFGNIDMGH